MLSSLAEFLQRHMLPCPVKRWLHLDCPGCGMQRSLVALLRGEFLQSLQLHPATVPMLVLLAATALHLRFRFARGAAVLVALYIGVAALSLGFYVYKLLHPALYL